MLFFLLLVCAFPLFIYFFAHSVCSIRHSVWKLLFPFASCLFQLLQQIPCPFSLHQSGSYVVVDPPLLRVAVEGSDNPGS